MVAHPDRANSSNACAGLDDVHGLIDINKALL